MRHPLHHGIPEAVPFDRGIAERVALVEQLAVLDEQQRLHLERRHGAELGIAALGKNGCRRRLTVAAENAQPGLRLLLIYWKQAEVGEPGHPERHARLALDLEMLG